jgi:hypothetical protein
LTFAAVADGYTKITEIDPLTYTACKNTEHTFVLSLNPDLGVSAKNIGLL